MDYGNTKIPNKKRSLGSTILSQLAYPEEGNPNFPWEKSLWDKTVVKSKVIPYRWSITITLKQVGRHSLMEVICTTAEVLPQRSPKQAEVAGSRTVSDTQRQPISPRQLWPSTADVASHTLPTETKQLVLNFSRQQHFVSHHPHTSCDPTKLMLYRTHCQLEQNTRGELLWRFICSNRTSTS